MVINPLLHPMNLLMVVLCTLGAPLRDARQVINQYDISAALPFYYRLCANGTRYIFTKDHYMVLDARHDAGRDARHDPWVPSNDTLKVPSTCSQFLGTASACFLSEISDRYRSLVNLDEATQLQKLLRYISNHCTST